MKSRTPTGLGITFLLAGTPCVQGDGLAAGTPNTRAASCGMTVTEDLLLTSDLDCVGSGSDGLDAGADGITIDLNGFSITGDETPGLAGVRVRGFQNVTVTNGTVRRFNDGIVIETDNDSKRTARAMITHIRASRNLGRGFLITSQPGDPPSAATLIYNTASGNGSEGILFDKGFFTTVGNTSRSNHGIGIGIGGAQGALFGDRAFHNAGSGLQVNDVVDADVPRQCINATQGVEISAPFIRGIWSCNAGRAADG